MENLHKISIWKSDVWGVNNNEGVYVDNGVVFDYRNKIWFNRKFEYPEFKTWQVWPKLLDTNKIWYMYHPRQLYNGSDIIDLKWVCISDPTKCKDPVSLPLKNVKNKGSTHQFDEWQNFHHIYTFQNGPKQLLMISLKYVYIKTSHKILARFSQMEIDYE